MVLSRWFWLAAARPRRPSPWPQVLGNPVGGEQLPVADQVCDDLGGSPAGCRAALADHVAVLVEQVAPVGQVCLAAVAVDVGQAGDALAGQPWTSGWAGR